MKLSRLLEAIKTAGVRGPADVEVSSVVSDSRQVSRGSLFVAVPGLQVDGLKYVDPAVEAGAVAVVAQRPLEREGVTTVEVEDARAALALLAGAFYDWPAKKISLIGITGTSGKTTTTKMVESILEATGTPVGLIGTIEYRAGETREIADRTTPDAVVLQQWFAKMAEAGVKYAVMEVSSHALALRRTHGVPFSAAVFTNLSRDHFDFHKDFDDYFAAKRMLFDQVDPEKRASVVNADDDYGKKLIAQLGDRVMTFGMSKDADIHPAAGFETDVEGLHGELATPAGAIKISSPLLGKPNLSNWMAAVGAALVVGIDPRTIERGVSALGSVRGRFERVDAPQGVTILVDYAHKPDALEKLLRSVRELAGGRRIVLVFGCGGDRDRGKRAVMGEIAAKLSDHTILTSDNPRSEDPESIVKEIERGFRGAGNGAECDIVVDRREAIERAVEMAGPERVVVIAGKGHENYQVIGDRIIHFDDREEVEAALRKRMSKPVV